ncbi:MAG TPA: FecR family protein [Rectinemataceae bacterium]|nr:FecR family protein [Rectinemataceae bacterium]
MKRIFTVLALLLVLPFLVVAQSATAQAGGQKFTLEFVDGSNLKVMLADKTELAFNVGVFEGDTIAPGATIITGSGTSAEFKLSPNGSIVKVGSNSTFIVKALAVQSGEKNAFQVAAGKIKTIAAKGSNISVSTPTAVCGVRGTDFVVDVENGKEFLAVKHGDVEFSKLDPSGNPLEMIHVLGGFAADALAAAFAPVAFPVSQYDQEFSDLSFKKLSETDVPQTPAEGTQTQADQGTQTTQVTGAEAAGTVAEGVGKMSNAEVKSGILKWLADMMGFELGSVTIDGTTYSKAIVQPNFNLGKLRFGLYLPVIYQNDLFNPNDWYKPAGNNEWSFGSDYNWSADPVGATLDLTKDVALKFKYVEYGRQLDDPFFIKVGNLNDLTIGHGLIMRNYDNSTEFPAVRRIGFNLGLDAGGFGFEALVNDLADPWLYGGRLYIRPVPGSKIALGLDGVVDTNPASDLTPSDRSAYGDPMFVSGGADLDMPIIPSNGFLSVRAFADVAATVPYTRTDITSGGTTIPAGLQYNLIFDQATGSVQNWGADAGFMGNVLFIDWRLEYRYYTGFFRPSFYDSTYDKMRASYVYQYYSYMTDASLIASSPTVMGIYGEGGFSLIKDKLSLKLGYGWPWDPSANSLEQNLVLSSDEFHAALVVKKGLIPIVDISGSIVYDRRGLAQSIVNGNFQLIDANTTFGGELVVPVPKTPNLDVAMVFASVPVRDSSGNIKYASSADAIAGIPELRPSISFATRFHF